MISVIVPVYNVSKYLKECVESIIHQDYNDYEVILVDDGSTDNSGLICNEYATKYPNIKVIHKQNRGLSSARNTGVNFAQGEWIVFVDSDDLWSHSKVLSSLNKYLSENHFDILRFEYQAVDDTLHPIQVPTKTKKHLENKILSNFELVSEGIAGEWFAWLYIINRHLFDSGLRFDETCRFQEDIDFYCKLFALSEYKCGYISDKLYLYRKRENSITTTYKINNLEGSFKLCDVFYNESLRSHDIRLMSLYKFNAVMMYYWTLCTLSEYPYYKSRKKIIAELSLKDLHKRTLNRIKESNIKNIYMPFICLPPYWGTFLLMIKNKIIQWIK